MWEAREAAEAQVAVEQAGRLAERAARRAAESHAATEQAAREAAEARIRQLEASCASGERNGSLPLLGRVRPIASVSDVARDYGS